MPAAAGLAGRRQRGIALVVALILLLVITLVGLAAVSGTLMQQKMSANFFDRQIAFQADEAAMRQAGNAIQIATASAVAPAGYPDCSPAGGNVCLADPFAESTVPTITTVSKTAFDAGGLSAAQPQYIVQYMGCYSVPNPTVKKISNKNYGEGSNMAYADFYRITARSGDPATIGGRASVVLQSLFRANMRPQCP